YNGTDTFTYKATDGIANSNEATVTLTITPVNDSPVANPDTVITDEDTPVVINILANDTDVDSAIDPSSVVIYQTPAHGSFSYNFFNGTVTYRPTPNY